MFEADLTYAIGDVHGCIGKLERLLDRCERHSAGRPYRRVFVGDYIDRGPDSRAVVALLMQAQREGAGEVVCLRGNHEAMAIGAAVEGGRAELRWLVNGGDEALRSYGVRRGSDLPPAHLAWLQALPLSHDDGLRYFVHAGIDPHRPLEQQLEADQLWIRERFLDHAGAFPRFIVHGHTPRRDGKPELRANRVNIDTGAVFGGPLTAAVFTRAQAEPIDFLAAT